MDLSKYIESGLISKRFIIALLLIGIFAYSGTNEGIVGAVVGYYFGTHPPAVQEA